MPFFADGPTSPVQPSPTPHSHSTSTKFMVSTTSLRHATQISSTGVSGAAATSSSGQTGSVPVSSVGTLPPGPPYPPEYASLGGLPSPLPDVPVCAIFLVLFLIVGVAHMKIFRQNKAKAHKFVFSAAMFAFCMIRVISMGLRIGWAYHETNIKLGIAAQIFTAAGIVILYICNLFFAQRLLNSRHPGSAFKILVLRPGVVVTILSIIMVIIVVVQSFYTLNPNTHRIDRDIELYALTYLTVIAFVPLLTVVLMNIVPSSKGHVIKNSSGTYPTNCIIVAVASTLLTFGAAWKAGVQYKPPILLPGTAWYYSKNAFYPVTFMIEFLVVLAFLLTRVDRRFYVPAPGQEQFQPVQSYTTKPAAPPTSATTAVASKATSKAPTGFNSPHESAYSATSEKTTYEEKFPLFLQVILDVDPDSGKYRVGTNPTVTEMRRGKSQTVEKDKL